jgi:predicted MFS family arabinose efflux permease
MVVLDQKKEPAISPILVIAITIFIDMTGFGMIIPLIPFLATSLDAGPSSIGILLASFSIMQFIFSPILGRLSDRMGRRPVLILSILTSIASFALFAVANSFPLLLLSRIVAGLATEGAVAQAYIADITTKKDRAKGLGRVGAARGIGFIVGPAIGAVLSPYGFWAPGALAVALGVINLLFVVISLPEPPTRREFRVEGSEVGFWKRILEALTTPLTGSVFLIYFFITLAFSTIPVIVPLLVAEYFGFTAVEMSYIFIFIGLLQVAMQGFAIGKLTMRIGEEKLIVLGPLLTMVGIILMPMTNSIPLFLLTTALMSAGLGITNTAVPSFVSQRTPPEEQGGILGVMQSVGSIARIPGPLVGGLVSEFVGLAAPFYVSGLILLIPFLTGCRVFRACTLKGL